MKLDDYEEFNNEKPDEEYDDQEENERASSTGSKIVIAVIFIAILALGAGAVFFSFKGDDESGDDSKPTSISAITVKESGKEPESSDASKDAAKEQDSGADASDPTEITTEFLPDNSTVTAKDVVNLRSMPSVTNENCEILGTLSKGETLQRTGIDYETGWSRLDFNGQTVYAVTSYLDVVK